MKNMTKSWRGAGAAAVALVSVVVPAHAQDRYDRHRDGISAGEIIAGAVVLGGLAAILSSGNNGRDDNRAGYSSAYRGGGGRNAVNQCVANVERWASGYNRSDVTQIRDVQRTRSGYRVKGNIVVQDGGRGYNAYDNDRYNRHDRNAYGRGYDKGRFTCTVEQGRVVNLDYAGLDQWR
jgi:hypothetical protein